MGTHRVATVLISGANPFEFGVACEVFGLRRPELGPPMYEHRLVVEEHPTTVNGWWTLDSPHGLEALQWADTILVPAAGDSPCHDPSPELVDVLRDRIVEPLGLVDTGVEPDGSEDQVAVGRTRRGRATGD